MIGSRTHKNRPDPDEFYIGEGAYVTVTREQTAPKDDHVSETIHPTTLTSDPYKNRRIPTVPLVATGLVAIGLAMVLYASSVFRREDENVSLPAIHQTRQEEDVRKISGRYGLPPAVVMADNNITSFNIPPDTQLNMNPVLKPRKIPREIGQLLYANLDPSYTYEDAYVADVVSGKEGFETVVVTKRPYSKSGKADTLSSRGQKGYVPYTREASFLKVFVLDDRGRKLTEEEYRGDGYGVDNILYPLGDGKQFLLRTTLTKNWFAPWMYRDIQIVSGSRVVENNGTITIEGFIPIGLGQSTSVMGRNVRVEMMDDVMKREGYILNGKTVPDAILVLGKKAVIIGSYFGYDIGNYTPGNYDGKAWIKRVEYFPLQKYLMDTTNPEFVAGELARMLFEDELSQEDIAFIARKNGDDLARAMDLIKKTRSRRDALINTTLNSILDGKDPVEEVAGIIGITDRYAIQTLLEHQIIPSDNPYIFIGDINTGHLEPWTFDIYRQQGRFAGVLPNEKRLFVVLDPAARQAALSGEATVGKDGALGIRMTFSSDIDASTYQVTPNFAIIDKEGVVDDIRDLAEKSKRGELDYGDAVSTALGVREKLGIGFDVNDSISGIANTIGAASDVVDILQSHGIQNVGDLRDLLNGDVGDIPAFSDMFKSLSDE